MKIYLLIVLMLSSQVAMAGNTTAPAYAIWNVDTGYMLAGKNSDDVRSMASITKLMTVLVVLNSGLDLDKKVTVRGRETSSRIRSGVKLSRRELIDLALVASDNLASRTLAETSGMSYSQFIKTMNMTARSLNMTNTNYADSTGLLATNTSTAEDIKILIQETEKWRVFHETAMVKTSNVFLQSRSGTRNVVYKNTNRLAGELELIGAKTGTTNAAGKCLTMFFSEGGQRYVLVILGAPNSKQRQKMVSKLIDTVRDS